MSFYSDLAATALRLITTYGQTVVFTRGSGQTYDPATGTYSGGTTTTITGKGAAFDYSNGEIDGTIVMRGDLRVLFEASSVAPMQNDNCAIDSVNYRVMNVSPLSPGGTVVIYDIQLRI